MFDDLNHMHNWSYITVLLDDYHRLAYAVDKIGLHDPAILSIEYISSNVFKSKTVNDIPAPPPI